MGKLTPAQLRELTAMAGRDYRSHYDSAYRPIVRLHELGYVDREDGRFGSSTYAITDAGRAALTSGGQDE